MEENTEDKNIEEEDREEPFPEFEGNTATEEQPEQSGEGQTPVYADELDRAAMLIRSGSLSEAQDILNGIKKKSGKKYFVQSLLFKEKGWYNEQRKQLKSAVKAEPENEEYKRELEELEKFRQTDEFKTIKRQQEMGDAAGICAECACTCCCEGACQAMCEGLGSC